jgi:hypothetical protein
MRAAGEENDFTQDIRQEFENGSETAERLNVPEP